MNKQEGVSWGLILLVALFSTLMFSPLSVYADSKPASPGFGDPINASGERVTGDAAKCKPGDSGCTVVGYKCYQSAKRSYYVNVQSECGVEDDGHVLDKDKNKICVKDKDGNCAKDDKGNVIYERRSVMWYMNRVINVVLGVMGVVTVAMIIMGGIQYTTSVGDAVKAQKAQKTIIFGIVGLIVALLAFAIVNFVLTSVFK